MYNVSIYNSWTYTTFVYFVADPPTPIPFHAVPSIIAVNMIMAGASGGILAVIIASWAQVRS